MGIEVAIAAAGLALSGVSMVQQRKQAKRSAAATRRAEEARMKQEELKQARERRQQVREARIRQGQVAQTTALQGAATSSAAAGGVASLQSQLASNLGFLDQAGAISGEIGAARTQAAQAQFRAQEFGALGSFGSSVFQAAGGFGTIFDAIPEGPTQQFRGGIAIPTRRPE